MRSIFLITNQSNSFLANELEVAKSLNCEINVITLKKRGEILPFAENIKERNDLHNLSFYRKGIIFYRMMTSHFFWFAILKNKKALSSIRFFFLTYKYLYGAFIIVDWALQHKNSILKPNTILYSYWNNFIPLGFAILKSKYKDFRSIKCYTRAHGYDVYEELVHQFFPYRDFTFQQLEAIYPCSQAGTTFLRERYKTVQHKIKTSRLGTLPYYKNIDVLVKHSKIVRVVSCSNIIAGKRVPLILENLIYCASKMSDITIEWHHFGDGDQMRFIKKRIAELSSKNFKCVLHGFVSNALIFDFYASQYVDCLVNLSLSEGLPVSMMEAISMQIPILANNVGGVSEIVNEQTGCLLDVNVQKEEFYEGLQYILMKEKELRFSTRQFWEKEFNAFVNYKDFYEQLHA
ncbi:MAG: glycosyltransferase [Bacteroidales bacterium]